MAIAEDDSPDQPEADGSASAAAGSVDIPYERFTLDNGLTVLVHEDRKAPIVAVNVWYHVGSKNERPGKTGFAHLFEHLMFNGSENADRDYIKAMEAIGATDLNGTTNEDRTNYFQNVPTPALDYALWMESDRMGHLAGAIDQAKLDEQRGVVKNEKRQGENQPYGVVRDLVTKAAFPAGHPYSWTVIGEMEDIDGASLEDVKRWFETYYGAANATVVLAGDIDAAAAREKVQRFFGDIAPGPPLTRQQAWIAKRSGERRQIAEDRVPQARVYKIWNVPQWGSQESVRLDLITDILAGGKNSRLYKRLVYDDQIATSVNAVIHAREIAGHVTLVGSAHPGGDLRAVERAMDEELTRFLEHGPDEGELARIKMQHRAQFIRGVERIGGFGGKSDILAKCQVFAADPDYYKRMFRWGQEATGEDLVRTARKWLSDGVYVLEVHPFPKRAASPVTADRTQAPAIVGAAKLDLPAFQRATLSNGLRVVLAERREIPSVEMSLIIDAGFAADQFAAPGVASMTMAMLDEGTKSRSSLEISEQLDRMGAALRGRSGLDTCYVALSALTDQLDPALDIFADVIENPAFPASDFERLRRQQLARIDQEKSAPSSTAFRLLPRLLFGSDHAYGSPLTGSGFEHTLQAMTREDLERFHRTWFQPSRATLTAAGDISLDALVDLLERRLSFWRDSGAPPHKNIAPVDPPAGRAVYIVDKPGSLQGVIIGGVPAPPTNEPDEYAIEVMNGILGGDFASRINQNIREEKHWSYGARTMLIDAKGPRPYLLYAPVQLDKTADALAEIDLDLRGIEGSKPITPEELDQARNNRTLRLPGRFETKRALLGAMQEIVVYGLPDGYHDAYADNIRAVDAEAARAAAEKIVRPDRWTWIVVGDRKQIEEPIKALGWGAVHHMSPDGEPLD